MKKNFFSFAAFIMMIVATSMSMTSCSSDSTDDTDVTPKFIDARTRVSANVRSGFWVNEDIIKYFDVEAWIEENGKIKTFKPSTVAETICVGDLCSTKDGKVTTIKNMFNNAYFVGYEAKKVSLPYKNIIAIKITEKQGIEYPATISPKIYTCDAIGYYNLADGSQEEIITGGKYSESENMPYTNAVKMLIGIYHGSTARPDVQ